MGIKKDLEELLEAQVISAETAHQIRSYYQSKEASGPNRLFVVFGVLGATLVGLGIILILAHNWDQLSRILKTIIAFTPLLIAQGLCAYTLFKQTNSRAWREASSAFLFFMVGACMSLISQIYNIPGSVGSFLFIWMLLCLPLLYIMGSSVASILYIVGITYYANETGYFRGPFDSAYWYWPMLLAALPHYFQLLKRSPGSNLLNFHHWVIPLSLIISLGTIGRGSTAILLFIAYFSLLSMLYQFGGSDFFHKIKAKNNGYLRLGSLGMVIILLILSFNWVWEDMIRLDLSWGAIFSSHEFFVTLVLTLLAIVLFYKYKKDKSWESIKPLEPLFLIFPIVFIAGFATSLAPILINIILLVVGVLTIRRGAQQDHLGILNYGLLIITALVVCRFFDSNWSFVLRGVLFVLIGIGFFVANYLMLKKRSEDEA